MIRSARHLLWLLPVGLAVVLGCSQGARDRLAAFFFEIPQTETSEPEAESGASATVPAVLPALELPPAKFLSIHQPVIVRDCAKCHDAGEQMAPREDMLDSCESCHARYFSPEVGHEPVADGECGLCHDMHRSEHLFLLRLPVLETCVDCHDEPEDLSEEAHGAEGVEQCTTCHDPHFGSPPLLKAERQAAGPPAAFKDDAEEPDEP